MCGQVRDMDGKRFNKVAKALSDPQRFALLVRIGREAEVACMALVQEFPITQATISHHLKELAGAGLVVCRREGKCCHFAFNAQALAAYQAELARRLPVRAVKAVKSATTRGRSRKKELQT